MNEKKLEVKNLQISFRTQGGNVQAVRDISFDLYQGETLAIVGESGSGKSVTSKAIIGILAGNAVVEGGEILYDGQDLLKITEDDFHKIRGDKISMIFQDPMSSLNPIMRVGKQLTEAMLLKGKRNQKKARKNFNDKLSLLKKDMNQVSGADQSAICQVFDQFCIKGNQLEQAYNMAYEQLVDLQLLIDEGLFLSEKKQKMDIKKSLKEIAQRLNNIINPYMIQKEEVDFFQKKIGKLLSEKESDFNEVIVFLKDIKEALECASKKEKPNYFTLGYYMMKYPQYIYENETVQNLNAMTRKFLDDDFMLKFIELGSTAISYSHQRSIENKKRLLSKIEQAMMYFSKDRLDKKKAYPLINELKVEVMNAIDHLELVRKSSEYAFYHSIKHELDAYFKGIEQNPRDQAQYDKRKHQYEKLVKQGKKPTWQVIPPTFIHLKLKKENCIQILKTLYESYQSDIEKSKTFDASKAMIALVDYFKEQASKVVYRVTKRMAKAKALKLLEEVGIPEPQIRYHQYPFEFSGGMRQRIVIAIALSANPDILICDEPTTALDVTIQSQILELINRIKQQRNLSVIFITHDLGVVANMADRIAVMYAGKMVEYGTVEDIFYEPRHPYTWALLSSMPDLETKEKLEAIPGTPPNMIYPPKGDAFAARNKYAMKIDFEQEPPLFKISETHYAATWLLHPNAPKVMPPEIIVNRIRRMKEALKDGNR